jgi:secondary thiamine-phosphate synthase enzyme
MQAHLKSSILGVSLTIPITNGELNLGTWQGIYLGEHRDFGGRRKIVAIIMGE